MIQKDIYINFNYTHTLEEIYGIPSEQILHIHGEVGKDNLKLFYKEIKIRLLENFLGKDQCKFEEIIVYGHSCAIAFDYFIYLNTRYSNAYWKFLCKRKRLGKKC